MSSPRGCAMQAPWVVATGGWPKAIAWQAWPLGPVRSESAAVPTRVRTRRADPGRIFSQVRMWLMRDLEPRHRANLSVVLLVPGTVPRTDGRYAPRYRFPARRHGHSRRAWPSW